MSRGGTITATFFDADDTPRELVAYTSADASGDELEARMEAALKLFFIERMAREGGRVAFQRAFAEADAPELAIREVATLPSFWRRLTPSQIPPFWVSFAEAYALAVGLIVLSLALALIIHYQPLFPH